MSAPTAELIDALWREDILFARRMTPIERMTAAGDLFDDVCKRMEDGIRHQFPEASPERVRQILFERVEAARRLEDRL